MKKITFLFLLALLPLMASAAIEVDGVYYYIYNEYKKEAAVGRGDTKYAGDINILPTITYEGVTYTVKEIVDHAFEGCRDVTSVTIPNSVTNIGRSAFSGCSGLTSVTIPSSVTSIGNSAFSGCSGLTSVTIPSNVTSIGNSAFSGCSGLTSISVENGNTVYDSRADCNAIIETATNTLIAGCKNTVIPNSVTSVGSGAFNGFSGLTSVTIPNSVSFIGEQAFSWCSSLRHVYCYAESVPKTKSNVFGHTSVSFSTLHVPAASIETYKVTSPWNEFGTIVAIAPSGVKTLESTQQDTDRQPDGKYMKNGKLIIIKEGKKYDAAGRY